MPADDPTRAPQRPAGAGGATAAATSPERDHQYDAGTISQHQNHHYRPQLLTSAAADLSALLARGQATLDSLSARLEAEYSGRFCPEAATSSSAAAAAGPVDPCALAQRVRRLERELPSLRAEAEAAVAQRRALAERAAALLGGSRARLHELSVRAGLGPPPPLYQTDQGEDGFDAAVFAAGEAATTMAKSSAAGGGVAAG